MDEFIRYYKKILMKILSIKGVSYKKEPSIFT